MQGYYWWIVHTTSQPWLYLDLTKKALGFWYWLYWTVLLLFGFCGVLFITTSFMLLVRYTLANIVGE